jgi:acyl-CoA thioesterase-1
MLLSVTSPSRRPSAPINGALFLRSLSALVIPALFWLGSHSTAYAAPPIRLVAFGDSLTAGYLLPEDKGFAAVLEKALRKDGFNVDVINAGVSGNTASDGLARLDWSLGENADAVVLELGANDMLQGIDPAVTEKTLDQILARLKTRHIKTLLAGMRATPSLGQAYVTAFDKIYPDLAAKYQVPLYPFFLDGVVTHPDLVLADGMHPTAAGVEVIVKGILPQVEALLRAVSKP